MVRYVAVTPQRTRTKASNRYPRFHSLIVTMDG
jgi:hypothetical protein